MRSSLVFGSTLLVGLGRADAASSLQLRRFGVQVHYDSLSPGTAPPSEMAEICAAAQITRNGAWWRHIEPTKGQYVFTDVDKWVASTNRTTGSACAAGPTGTMLNHFVMNGGNHLYTGTDQTPPTTPEAVEAYANFAVALLSHHAGQGILWEIFNEADIRTWSVEQYGNLVIAVGKAVRANPAISSEILIGPSVSTVDCAFVKALKSQGALQYVDAVSVHSYCSGAPEQMKWQYDAMKALVGPATAVLSGEWGWSTCTSASGAPANCVGGTEPDIVSETDQAMYVARQWLVNAMEGIPVSIYYDYLNDCSDGGACNTAYDRTSCELNWGLRMASAPGVSGAAKPSYHAAVAVQSFVGRRPFLANLGGGSPMVFVLAFGAAGDAPPPAAALGAAAVGGAEVFSVHTLSTEGGVARQTGTKDGAYCAGEALWTGMATDCEAKCKEIAGCRGFVSYATGTVHENSNCQLTGSRCTVPRPVSGCGINIPTTAQTCPGGPSSGGTTSSSSSSSSSVFNATDPACDTAVAHTLTQSASPPPVTFTNPAGARFNCYTAYDVLGQPVPSKDVCAAAGGLITVHATESPVYLVGKS